MVVGVLAGDPLRLVAGRPSTAWVLWKWYFTQNFSPAALYQR